MTTILPKPIQDNNATHQKDGFFFEALSIPTDIGSMACGRFFDPNIETIIVAKVYYFFHSLKLNLKWISMSFFFVTYSKASHISMFNYDATEDTFVFIDHMNCFRPIYQLCVSPQPLRFVL